MSIEIELLQALSKRDNYNKYEPYLNKKALHDDTRIILKDFGKWFKLYEDKDVIDFDSLETHVLQNWHKKDFDEQDIIYYKNTYFPTLKETRDVDCSKTVLALYQQQTNNEIIDNIDNYNKVRELLENYQDVEDKILGTDVGIFDIADIDLSAICQDHGLPWAFKSLEKGFGRIVPGQFIVACGDSSTGKSAFCLTIVVEIFKHLHKIENPRPILYATSEDTQEDLAARFFSNLYHEKIKGGFEEILERREEVQSKFRQSFNSRLLMPFQIDGPHDMIKIEKLAEKYNPAIIIIDILDKLAESDDQKDLTKVYGRVRSLANKGFPILATSQSGNTGYYCKETNEWRYRRWLTDKDMANSKFGKQGACYAIIGIGKETDDSPYRFINTTKKKRGKNIACTCELIDKFSLYKEQL
jgi:KaiC/GvpD/RAD55 family RecA-like ATPase